MKGFPSGATVGYAKSQIRDILKSEFNRTVELQVMQKTFSISMWHRKKNHLGKLTFVLRSVYGILSYDNINFLLFVVQK